MTSLATNRKNLGHVGIVLACCMGLACCGGTGALSRSDRNVPPFREPAMSMQQAHDAIEIGKSAKADVLAALGPAREIKFDSGYTVWVYRAAAGGSDTDRAEYVILFAQSGIVTKTRLRPAYVAKDPN